MLIMGRALTLLVPALAAVYTFNYGRWALRNRRFRGAVGLFLIAVATLLLPGLMIWVQR